MRTQIPVSGLTGEGRVGFLPRMPSEYISGFFSTTPRRRKASAFICLTLTRHSPLVFTDNKNVR
jgi:hypothetical protein